MPEERSGAPPGPALVVHARRLWYLQLVTQCGSFAAAARAAGVTQPAITLALQELQNDLGIVLFTVAGRRRLPTPAASRLVDCMAQGQERLDRALRAEQAGPGRARRGGAPQLRIGMLPGSARTYAECIAPTWRARHPDGQLVIRMDATVALLDMLRADELDLAILPRPRHVEMSGMSFDVLRSSRPVICARDGHPLAGASSLGELQGAHWAATGLLPAGNEVIEEACRVRGLPPPHLAAYCPDVITLLHLVAHSDLLCVVSHPELIDSGLRRLIKPIRILDNLPRLETGLFLAKTGRQARRRADLEAIREVLLAAAS